MMHIYFFPFYFYKLSINRISFLLQGGDFFIFLKKMSDKPVSSKSSSAAAAASSQLSSPAAAAEPEALTEVIPKTGLVFSEKSTMVELLCKPKLMPIKSEALIRLEALEKEATIALNAAATANRVATAMGGGAKNGDGRLGTSNGKRL